MNKIKAQLEENQNSVMMFWVLGVREREDPMTRAGCLPIQMGMQWSQSLNMMISLKCQLDRI